MVKLHVALVTACICMEEGRGASSCTLCTSTLQVLTHSITHEAMLFWYCLGSALRAMVADSKCWQACKAGSTAPPALAAHTLTAVGQHGIFCFGGQGKRVYNAVHKLDPSTCRWELVKTIGVRNSVHIFRGFQLCFAESTCLSYRLA